MRNLEMNPYVIQVDKFVQSLEKLSQTFLQLEEKRNGFSEEELMEICEKVFQNVCYQCGNRDGCLGREKNNTYHMLWKVFQAIEDCGTELSVEVKRNVQNGCANAPKLLSVILDEYKEAKQTMVWNQKIAQNREGCAVQLGSFAKMIQHATHELDASIFSDEYLEKKIRNQFSKLGIRILTTVFLMSEEGRYEIHITTKAKKGQCITTKELAGIISDCCGRNMVLRGEERLTLSEEYCTVVFVEGARYHTLQGVAKIGKGCRRISGDSFSLLDLPGGKKGIILSDGMGAGENASRESVMVVELLEELLDAGFPVETALQMLNTALVIGREEVRFSTIDISLFDLYSGKCEFIKAGAAMSFIKRADKVERVRSTSLPIGVLPKLEMAREVYSLEDGDFVVMLTDGVLDALPVGEQEFIMQMIIEGTQKKNPKEISQHILEQVMECSGEIPVDDMTVLVAGIWSLEK